MANYRCSNCQQPTTPILCSVGVSGDCCPEAQLEVPDDSSDWRMMDGAPKDGSDVQLLIRHRNFDYAVRNPDVSDPSQWEQEVTARWIEHNGGGWTWNGIMGAPIGWRPLYRPLTAFEEDELKRELFDDLPRTQRRSIERSNES